MHVRLWSACASAFALAIGASTTAFAAPDPGQGWDGVYVGGETGAQWTSSHFDLPGDTADRPLSDHASATNWFGGGLVGFNHQSGDIVLGVEGDLTGGDNKQKVVDCTTPDGCWTPAHDSWTTYNNLKLGLEGHVRVRAGIVSGRTLFYVAGGYSVAKSTLDLQGDCFNPADPSTPLVFGFSRSKTLSGYNVGVGLEHKISSRIALRAEYVYDDFGQQLYRGDGVEWNDRLIDVQNSSLRFAATYTF